MRSGGSVSMSPGGRKLQYSPRSIWRMTVTLSVTINLVVLLILSLHKGAEDVTDIGSHSITTQGTCSIPTTKEISSKQNQKESNASATFDTHQISKDVVINLNQGDPTMFEAFWKGMGSRGEIVIPGWQGMSYFSNVTNLCWFLELEFERQIRRLHEVVGNAVIDGRYIVVGTGSTQLFQAALFALSPPDAVEPMSVVSAVPYYSSYPAVTNYLRSGLFRWAGDANTFQGDTYIELVCSPNNPDGHLKEAVLHSEAGKTIHDLAYYWPQYTPITGPADRDIMLFTVSKSTGHAGTRLGWALVRDKDVAQKMVEFIVLNTIGVSKDSQLRAAKLLGVVSDTYELPTSEITEKLFHYGRRIMAMRWKKLREAVKTSGIFTIPDFPSAVCQFTGERTTAYPAFAWLKCEKLGVEDCETLLRSHNILARGGKLFGVEPIYVRVSMMDRDEIFQVFIERLSSIH